VSAGVLGVLAAVAVLLLPSAPRRRASRSRGRRPSGPVVVGPGARVVAATAVGIGAAAVVGGVVGGAVGLAAATGTLLGLSRLEPRARRRTREAVERGAPLALDLVAACLASGAGLDASVAAAAAAVGGPTGRLLRDAVAAARLGAPPSTAWRDVAAEPALAGLARAVVRAHDTGAPLGEVLPRLAAAARASRRSWAEARVRTAAVRLTGPLGLAFLPAFVLLGVVPVVASWVGALL
jgi:Flp pilus assembly protein TadB